MTGSTTRRGYGTAHQRLRAATQRKINHGQPVTCWRCHTTIQPGEPWDLGHDDNNRHLYRGPEHQRCNRAAAGRRSAELRPSQHRPTEPHPGLKVS